MKSILFFAFVGLMYAQTQPVVQHAPTAEQCRTDQRLWDSQFPEWADASGNDHHFSSPLGRIGMKEVLSRRTEMHECEAVDPASIRDYRMMFYYLSAIVADRFIHYFLTTKKVDEYGSWEAEQRQKE
jgi:hypothetical protein